MADSSIPAALVPNETAPSAPTLGSAPAPKDFSPEISEDPNAAESNQYLVDKAANKTIKVSSSQVPSMILTGQYDLPAMGKQYALDKKGELVQVENTKYADALRAGVVLPASDADVRKEMYEQKYGSSEGTAAIAGAVRGLSMGLSDPFLTNTGFVKAGTLAGLESANPVSSVVGEVGGTIAGMFVPVGPIAATGKAGIIAEEAAAKMLSKGAIEAKLGSKVINSIIEKYAPKIVGGAVEGTLYGTGNLISESALGKADFNAENVAASAGIGALFGTGLGIGFSVLKEAAPYAAKAGGKIVGLSEDFLNKEKNAQELLGISNKNYNKYSTQDKQFGNKVVEALNNPEKIGLKPIGETAESLSQKVEAYQERAGKQIETALDSIKETSVANPKIMPEARTIYTSLSKEASSFAKSLEAAEGLSRPDQEAAYNTAKKWEERYTELAKVSKPGQRLDIGTMQKMRQDLDVASKWNAATNPDAAKVLIAKELRGVLRSSIDEMADKVGTEVGASLKQANADYYLSSKLVDHIAEKAAKSQDIGLRDLAFGGLVHTLSDSTGITVALLGAKKILASDLRRRLVTLGYIEKANMSINKALDTSTAKFFSSGAVATTKAIRLNATAKLSEFSLARSEDNKKPQNMAQAYNNIQQNLANYTAHPEKMQDRIQANTNKIASTAPDTTAALTMTGSNAVNFLNSKLPRKLNDPSMLQRPYLPSGTELAKFERYLTAVEKPVEVLKNFADGKMSREESEALQTVYPNMYQSLQEKAMSFVGANPHLPYNKKLQLGILLNIPTDPSLQPQNILGLQGNFNSQQSQPAQSDAGAVRPSQKGLQDLSFDSRIEGREED